MPGQGDSCMMKITKTVNGSSLCLVLEGRLDTVSAPDLEVTIGGSVNGMKELIIDMQALDDLSSAGLRVLLSAQRIMSKQGIMRIIHVNDIVMETFEAAGFADILHIEK